MFILVGRIRKSFSSRQTSLATDDNQFFTSIFTFSSANWVLIVTRLHRNQINFRTTLCRECKSHFMTWKCGNSIPWFCWSKSYKRDSWRDIEVYWKLADEEICLHDSCSLFFPPPHSFSRYVFVISTFILSRRYESIRSIHQLLRSIKRIVRGGSRWKIEF